MANKLFQEHEAARIKAENKVEKASTQIKGADYRIIGAGHDGKGTKGHLDKEHADAQAMMKPTPRRAIMGE